MTVQVKICGINSVDAYAAAAEAGADWVGFVFFPPSPRAVTPTEAASFMVSYGPKPVGLFVDPTDATIEAVLASVRLAAIQVYASADRALAIKARFGLPVWRAVPVAASSDLPAKAAADAYVIEPKPPAGATRPGGNAVRLDWALLSGWSTPAPWLLAGGLTPDNVAEAVRVSGAQAVDVSSGVEAAPGRKDPGLIRAFIAAARC
jgi:phosphoribosylanthranilate isomerase